MKGSSRQMKNFIITIFFLFLHTGKKYKKDIDPDDVLSLTEGKLKDTWTSWGRGYLISTSFFVPCMFHKETTFSAIPWVSEDCAG